MTDNDPIPLGTMLGVGETFAVGERRYRVRPLLLKEVEAFADEQMSIGPQLFNFLEEKARACLDRWIRKQVVDASGEPMTVEKAIEDGWTLADLRRCVHKILDLSG